MRGKHRRGHSKSEVLGHDRFDDPSSVVPAIPMPREQRSGRAAPLVRSNHRVLRVPIHAEQSPYPVAAGVGNALAAVVRATANRAIVAAAAVGERKRSPAWGWRLRVKAATLSPKSRCSVRDEWIGRRATPVRWALRRSTIPDQRRIASGHEAHRSPQGVHSASLLSP